MRPTSRNDRSRTGPRLRPSLRLALLTLAAACGDATGVGPVDPGNGGGNPGPKPVARVTVSPGAAQLLPGDTVRLTVTAQAADSSVLADRVASWTSFNSSVAIVTPAGLLRAVGSGSTTIRVAVESVTADVAVQVQTLNPAPTLTSVSPDSTDAGHTVAVLTLTGSGFAADAAVLWNGASRPANYISPTELRLVLGPSDLTSAGPRTIAVQNPAPGGGTSASLPFTIAVGVASIAVTPAQARLSVGQSTTLQARALDAEGAEVLGRVLSWTSSNPGAASVSATGTVLARNPGPAIITVSAGGRSAQVSITVVAPVQSLHVTPSPAAVLVGSLWPLTARTFTAGMVEVTDRLVTWSSENPAIATVDAQGRIYGVTKGTTRIRAESEGVAIWTTVEVRQWGPGPDITLTLRGFTETMVWPDVGLTTWVDGSGVSYPATKSLYGGVLTLHFDTGRWERTWDIRITVAGRGEVARETWTEQGALSYIFGGGGYRLTSDATGQSLTAYDQMQGELLINQSVGTSVALTQRWVVQ